MPNRLQQQFAKMREQLTKEGVSSSEVEKLVAGVEQRYSNESEPQVAIIGECGVGKTSTINALFGAGMPVSHFEPCTKDAIGNRYQTPSGEFITVYDMPGIGESIQADRQIIDIYKKIYPQVDVIMWIVAAGDRQLAMMQHLLLQIAKETGSSGLQRLVFAINKADVMYPNDWNTRINLPSQEQSQYLQGFSNTVLQRIREIIPKWSGAIPVYSAIKAYNLKELLLTMLQASPKGRGHFLNARSNLDNPLRLVDDPAVKDVAYQMFAENRGGVSYGEHN
jgi:predicted GTPase